MIKPGIAIISVNRAMLDPSAFPYERIGFPARAELIPTIVSGREVATETSRKLIVYPDTLSASEMLVVDLIKRFTALISVNEAIIIREILNNAMAVEFS